MELILISNTKLKIMLDEGDMRRYKISDDTDCAEPEARKAIRNILEKAREQIGFNTEGAEIFVQLYTSRSGGCELFVTKSKHNEPILSRDSEDRRLNDGLSLDKKTKRKEAYARAIDRSEIASIIPQLKESCYNQTVANNGKIAFSFPSLSILCKACKILYKASLKPASKAFTDSLGLYYLFLFNTGISAYSCLDKLTFLHEYGKRENPDYCLTYINEHGKPLCEENAIETLSQF